MKLISHRGNINGKIIDSENTTDYIDNAIKLGYDVEVDVWYVDNLIYLGHDNPQHVVNFTWIKDRIEKLWIHCKNIDAVLFFKSNELKFNYFWHENDTLTLTSLNHLWVYPGKQPVKNSIAVLPEINNDDIIECFGVCSDHISKYVY